MNIHDFSRENTKKYIKIFLSFILSQQINFVDMICIALFASKNDMVIFLQKRENLIFSHFFIHS